MKKELSWQFIAGNKQEKDGRFLEATFVTVTAINEKQALVKARTILKRNIWFLKSVMELDNKMDRIINKMETL